jgi:hypothetical protein
MIVYRILEPLDDAQFLLEFGLIFLIRTPKEFGWETIARKSTAQKSSALQW